jgi:hypothetical protein
MFWYLVVSQRNITAGSGAGYLLCQRISAVSKAAIKKTDKNAQKSRSSLFQN